MRAMWKCRRSATVTLVGERECTLQRRHQKVPRSLRAHRCRPVCATAARGHPPAGRGGWLRQSGHIRVPARLRPDERRGFCLHRGQSPASGRAHSDRGSVRDRSRQGADRAGGIRTLAELGLAQADVLPPRGLAIQLRVNLETMDAAGAVHPTGGTLSVFEPPSGPGIRMDTFGYGGHATYGIEKSHKRVKLQCDGRTGASTSLFVGRVGYASTCRIKGSEERSATCMRSPCSALD